jgi:S1-C subfamily serine protease
VIGINSQIETGGNGSRGNVGIGFAVPIDTAKRLLPELKKGSVETGYLGITSRTIDDTLDGLNLPVDEGVLVIAAQPGSPAARAGIRGGDIPAQVNGEGVNLGGDIITKVDGKTISSSEQLSSTIGRMKKGDEVKVELVRDGKRKTVTVTLAQRPQTDVGQQTPQGQEPGTP